MRYDTIRFDMIVKNSTTSVSYDLMLDIDLMLDNAKFSKMLFSA